MWTRTVLHVDDDARLRDGLARALRREPYELLGVGGATEALALLRGCLIDVVVCDEAMPGMLGTEFLAQVRREFPDVVSILLTGYGSVEVAQRAVNEGEIFRLLTKPCDPRTITVAIRQALARKLRVERTNSHAQPSHAPAGILAPEDPYPGVRIFEVDDTSVDLEQLLMELEHGVSPFEAPRRPASRR